jgi:3-methyladenine DNA glycosylase/8-oxoguanine DNA glycosylase
VSTRDILLPLPSPIDLALTVASHGWAHLAPWRWDGEGRVLARQERIDGRLGTIEVAQHELGAVVIRHAGFTNADGDAIRNRVRRWLSVDWEPADAIAALGDDGTLIAAGGGRLLRCSSFYEDFVKTVLTINTAWSSTCRMAAALVAEPGGGGFPTAEAVLDYGEERLRRRAKLGFRAPTVISATRRMLEDGAIDAAGEGRPDYQYLIGLSGIGPYAAAHCRVLLHDFSRIPVDSVVTAHLRERHAIDPAAFVASRAGWGAYLALGYRLARLRDKLEAAASR